MHAIQGHRVRFQIISITLIPCQTCCIPSITQKVGDGVLQPPWSALHCG